MLRVRELSLIFIPAILFVTLGLSVQIIRFEPQFPKVSEVAASKPIQIPILPDDPLLGERKAPIAIIAFADLGCGACREEISNFLELTTSYPRKLKVIWKFLPVTKFPEPSDIAHDYAYCANKQNKFADFLKADISVDDNLSSDALQEIAQKIKLDKNQLTACLDDKATASHKQLTSDIAATLGINTVPAIYRDNNLVQRQTSVSGWTEVLGLSGD